MRYGVHEIGAGDIPAPERKETMDKREARKGNVKRYPFNMSKNQHNIFYWYNRTKNEIMDLEERAVSGEEVPGWLDKVEALEELEERLENLLSYGLGVVWLTGPEWDLANETVLWAEHARDVANNEL